MRTVCKTERHVEYSSFIISLSCYLNLVSTLCSLTCEYVVCSLAGPQTVFDTLVSMVLQIRLVQQHSSRMLYILVGLHWCRFLSQMVPNPNHKHIHAASIVTIPVYTHNHTLITTLHYA